MVGAAGQLGRAVLHELERHRHTVGLTRRDVDLSHTAEVRRRLIDLAPWAIVNCAGYNDVDGAEDHAEAALAANAFAVLTLARAAAEIGAVFVQYSSDFVFDGDHDRPYVEEDRPAPQSVYAASKLLGEWFASEAPAHYVLRVESLFGGPGPNKSSLDRIIQAVAAGGHVRAFTDRIVTPSYACDIARATAALLRARPEPGIYHCVNTGAASWFDVALEIRGRLGTSAEIEPVRFGDVMLRARRPRYCALDNGKLARAAFAMPAWQDALERALAARGAAEG